MNTIDREIAEQMMADARMASDPQVSLIICTFNRADRLRRLLASVEVLREPEGGIEIIVVDNNSSDDTARLVAEFDRRVRWPVRYLFEPAQGLSLARNRGVAVARGNIIAFTDDDTIVPENWLIEAQRAFGAYPDAAVIGGKVVPNWQGDRPRWFSAEFQQMLALHDLGEQALLLDAPTLIGANFVCRAKALDRAPPFDPRLGHVGATLRGGDETDLLLRILAEGSRIYYLPSLVVQHVIEPDRLQKRFFRKLAFERGTGRSIARSWSAAHTIRKRAPHAIGRVLRLLLRRRMFAAEVYCISYFGVVYGTLPWVRRSVEARIGRAQPVNGDTLV